MFAVKETSAFDVNAHLNASNGISAVGTFNVTANLLWVAAITWDERAPSDSAREVRRRQNIQAHVQRQHFPSNNAVDTHSTEKSLSRSLVADINADVRGGITTEEPH